MFHTFPSWKRFHEGETWEVKINCGNQTKKPNTLKKLWATKKSKKEKSTDKLWHVCVLLIVLINKFFSHHTIQQVVLLWIFAVYITLYNDSFLFNMILPSYQPFCSLYSHLHFHRISFSFTHTLSPSLPIFLLTSIVSLF